MSILPERVFDRVSFWEKSPKQKNREKAEWNKAKGDVSEDILMDRSRIQGNSVEKRDQGRGKGGYDFKETPRNIFGQRTGPNRLVEAKSNEWTTTTSNQDKYKARYKNWERRNANIDSIPGANVLIDGRVLMNRFKKKEKDGTLFSF